MSHNRLLGLFSALALGRATRRHDPDQPDLPTALGDRALRFVLGGSAPSTTPWLGLKGVAPGQKGPADFGLASVWPPPRPLHAERLPATTTPEEARANVYAALGWQGSREPGDERIVIRSVRTPAVLQDVRIDHAFVEHVAKHASRGRFANYILPTLSEPHEVWLTQVGSSRGAVFRHQFLAAFDDGTTAVIAADASEALVAWNFFPVKRRADIRKRRKGLVLYSWHHGEGNG